MTDYAHQAATTQQQAMLRRAEHLTRARERFSVPHGPEDLPSVADASAQLSDLAGLVQDLAAQVHLHADADQSAADRECNNAAAFYWSWAAKRLSWAAGRYATACHNIALLRRNSPQPQEHPLQPRLRRTAFAEAQQDIADARDGLTSARAALEMGADHFQETSPLSEAARARSAQTGHACGAAPVETESPTASRVQEPPHTRGAGRAR
ncbi:hypothetical protein [Streptomyces smyrnaeus]|uniref:hypothetical protein n=1 Tax=Streptomyces smyrnaeus TaxID=1387713 RepID=UPI00368A4DB4